MVKFDNVSKKFGRSTVLDDISLDILPNDRVALIGSNGAGKTTMIRCLLGEYVYDGEILVDQLEPRAHRQEILKNIGFVPQLPPPLKMPVAQLINFAAAVSDSDPAEIYQVSSQLGLDAKAIKRQPFVKLSGGQKQKLLVSIALGRECNLLVMDEPAANLDPEARHTFFSLLAKRRDHSAMIISSHRLDEVAALVNRVVEMDQGKIVLDDRVADEVDMDSFLTCELTLSRFDAAFEKTILEWGFSCNANSYSVGDHVCTGRVAGPDRLRFLGMLSRYSGLLKGISMQEESR